MPGALDCRKSRFSARYCFELIALRPKIRRRARYGNVAISCRKHREIGEKFHCRAAEGDDCRWQSSIADRGESRDGNGGTGDGDQIKMKFFAKYGLSTRSSTGHFVRCFLLQRSFSANLCTAAATQPKGRSPKRQA